jgi:hypothetical protein
MSLYLEVMLPCIDVYTSAVAFPVPHKPGSLEQQKMDPFFASVRFFITMKKLDGKIGIFLSFGVRPIFWRLSDFCMFV